MSLAWLTALAFVFAQGCSAGHHNQRNLRSAADCDTSKAIIVMSKGRSGSAFVSDIIARNLMNHNFSNITEGEILGENMATMEYKSNPLEVIQEHICHYGANNEYVSFKWKPLYWNNAYMEALKWVAEEKIPVVFNVRNPIDVFLSNMKHTKASKDMGNILEPHCVSDDAKCLERFKNHELVNVDPAALLQALHSYGLVADEKNRALLLHSNVHFIPIEYESLIADEISALRVWRKIFEFIAPTRDWSKLTTKNLTSSFSSTSSSNHRDKINNYNEVHAVLRGTRFASLLH
jgi:hypothetical protein